MPVRHLTAAACALEALADAVPTFGFAIHPTARVGGFYKGHDAVAIVDLDTGNSDYGLPVPADLMPLVARGVADPNEVARRVIETVPAQFFADLDGDYMGDVQVLTPAAEALAAVKKAVRGVDVALAADLSFGALYIGSDNVMVIDLETGNTHSLRFRRDVSDAIRVGAEIESALDVQLHGWIARTFPFETVDSDAA